MGDDYQIKVGDLVQKTARKGRTPGLFRVTGFYRDGEMATLTPVGRLSFRTDELELARDGADDVLGPA